ncbi:MAG: hypothetical protein PHG95_04420 [Patescibacteria group bacterium]|nr:hypothetical protein [Patescibacteria group bacterium]
MSLYGRWYDFKSHLGSSLKLYWRYRPNRWYLLIGLVSQIILWFFAYRLFVAVGSDLFVSHYNVDFGIDGIGSSRRAFLPPILSFAVLGFNSVLTLVLGKGNHFHFFAHAAGLSALVAQIMAALALMSLYLINFLA